MFRKVLLILVLFSLSLHAKEPIPPYGRYNLRKILVTLKQEDGTETHAMDMRLLNTVLMDLHHHANEYPPKFTTRDSALRARSDARVLSKLFEAWPRDPKDLDLQLKVARLFTLAHNLDVPGSVARADTAYKRLIEYAPKNPVVHYTYGSFLAHTGRNDGAVKHLERAVELNFPDALRNLALARLAQGKPELAKTSLIEYLDENPQDKMARTVLTAIEQGNVRVHAD